MKTAACRGLLVLIHSATLLAQWSTAPRNNLIVAYEGFGKICEDGTGGAYVTTGSRTAPRILLRRINRYGYPAWSAPREIRGEWPGSGVGKVCPDGSGGVVIGFSEDNDPPWPWLRDARARVQRVDISGNLLWGLYGVRVSLVDTLQDVLCIVSDGHGGFIVMYAEMIDPYGDSVAVNLQRLSGAGTRLWGDSGIGLFRVPNELDYYPRVVGTTDGGFVAGSGPWLKRVALSGNLLWNGQVRNVGFLGMNLAADLEGGVIAYGRTAGQMVTQRIDSLGNLLWPFPYLVLSRTSLRAIFSTASDGYVYPMSVKADGSVVFAWTAVDSAGVAKCITQRVRGGGGIVFQPGGILVSNYESENSAFRLIDGNDERTNFVFWDSRYTSNNFYAQQLDTTAMRMWPDTDVAVVSSRYLWEPQTISDGRGGFILAGFDLNSYTTRIQQVSVNGILGEIITSLSSQVSRPNVEPTELLPNFPNPFNPLTIVNFQLPVDNWVTLKLYDILGREARTLVDGYRKAGYHNVTLDASNLASGVYFYRLIAGSFVQTRKLLLMR